MGSPWYDGRGSQSRVEVTDEQREKVYELLRQKWTSNKIAAELGVPRNAVCGLKHRYNQKHKIKIGNVGVTKRQKSAKLRQGRKKGKPTAPYRFRETNAVVLYARQIHEIEDHECKYSVTSHNEPPANHRFCGKPQRANSSYCEEHHKLCHETVNERKAKSQGFAASVPVWLITRFNYA